MSTNPYDNNKHQSGEYSYKPPKKHAVYHTTNTASEQSHKTPVQQQRTQPTQSAQSTQPSGSSNPAPQQPPKKKFPKWLRVVIILFLVLNIGLPVLGGIIIELQARLGKDDSQYEKDYGAPSVEEMQVIEDADNTISSIEVEYRVDGYVPQECVEACVSEVSDYAASLVEQGVLEDYYNDGDSVWMIDSNGLQTVYIPSQEDTLSFNTNEYYSITTIEPHEGTFSELGEMYLDKNEEAAAVFDNLSEQWFYTSDLNTQEVTPGVVKTFGENQIILWLGHGAWVPGAGSCLVTGERFDAQRYATDKEYRGYFGSGQWARTAGERSQIIITPEYIAENMGSIKNSVVFLGACKSSESVELVSTFLKKGALAVVGNSDTVKISYYALMMRSMVETLCSRDDAGQFNTFGTALNLARQEYGIDDSVRCGGIGAKVEIFGQDVYDLRITDVISEEPTVAQTEPATEAPTQPPKVDVHQLLANYASQFSYLNGTTGYTGAYTKTQYRNVYSYNLPDQPVAYTIADFDQDNVEELLIVDTNSDNTVKLEMYEVSGGSVVCNAEIDLPTPIAGSAENGTTEYFYFYRNGALQICVSELSIADRVASGTILRCAGAIYDGSSFSYQGMAEIVGTAGEDDPFAGDMAALGINNVNVYDMLSGYKLATDYINSCTVFCTARYMCTIMDGEWITYQDVWFTDESLTYLEISYIGFKKDLLSA